MTLPNILSLFRCVAVLVVAALIVWPGGSARAAALAIFAVAAATDWLDGWIARRFHMTSELGRVLDIIADKLLVAVVLVMLCAEGTVAGINALAVALILAREIGISGVREHLAARDVVIPASLAGKWKTTAQLVAIVVLLAAPLAPAAFGRNRERSRIGDPLGGSSAHGVERCAVCLGIARRVGGPMKLKYFAWVRERVGVPEEEIALPAGVVTAGDLITWLKGRGEGYAYALENDRFIRVAADHEHVTHDTPVNAAREVALFPPMTGG